MKKPTIEDWEYDGIHIETPSKRYLTQEEQVKAYSNMIDALIEAKNTIKVFADNNSMNVRAYASAIITINKALKKAGCE